MCISITVVSVMAYIHIMVIVKQVSVFLCSARKNKSYDISSPTISDGTRKTSSQADVMVSHLNADGPLSLNRSGCWTTSP